VRADCFGLALAEPEVPKGQEENGHATGSRLTRYRWYMAQQCSTEAK
jgi:hypothetical protein